MDAGRVLAIDPGRRRVGLAISDPLGNFAVGLDTLDRRQHRNWQDSVAQICEEKGVCRVIVGLPVNMDGSEGPKAKESREIANQLSARLGLPVELVDERLTSVIAHQALKAQGIQASRQKGLVDQTAAQVLLQNYLDRGQSDK